MLKFSESSKPSLHCQKRHSTVNELRMIHPFDYQMHLIDYILVI